MNFSKGFEEGLLNIAVKNAERVAKRFEGRCDSPIETAFATAFVISVENVGKRCEILSGQESWFEQFAAIAPQHRLLGKYRVDFMVALHDFTRRAVVECDGREFHHATREQIDRDRDRDRAIEEEGLKVFRFPGAQIHSEPFDCVGQVLLWLLEGPRHEASENADVKK